MARFRDDLPSTIALLVTIAAVLLTFGAIVSVFAPELTADDSTPAEVEHEGPSATQTNETTVVRVQNETTDERERNESTDAEMVTGDTADGGDGATPTPESEGDEPTVEPGLPSDDPPERPEPESELGDIERAIEQAVRGGEEDRPAERDSDPFDDDERGQPDTEDQPDDS